VRGAVTVLSIFVLCTIALAQYGTAPPNYYPSNFNGSMFTGTVTDNRDNHLTLTYSERGKDETLSGGFEAPCSVPGSEGRHMTPGDVPKGTEMTVLFNSNTKKVDGKKTRETSIVGIIFHVWKGQTIAEDQKRIYWCTDHRYLRFRAF